MATIFSILFPHLYNEATQQSSGLKFIPHLHRISYQSNLKPFKHSPPITTCKPHLHQGLSPDSRTWMDLISTAHGWTVTRQHKTMWFFGCGNRRKSGMADISTSRYPVAPGQSPFACHRRNRSPMLNVFASLGTPGNAFGQPYYSGGMAPSFYYPQQSYTYGMPHPPQYAAAQSSPSGRNLLASSWSTLDLLYRFSEDI